VDWNGNNQWDATDDDPKEHITFGAYAQRWLDNRQVSGRPIKARTREHYQAIIDDHLSHFDSRQLAAIKPKDVRGWYEATLVDRPTMRSHAYSLLRTIMASAVVDELIDANPCRIVGAGRAKRVHKIRPASVEELGVLTAEMPEKLRLMVTLASWCALRFGEAVELRRGDVDLSQEVIRIRRAAVRTKGAYTITTPKSDAGLRDVAIPPHIIPAIEQHLAKQVERFGIVAGRDVTHVPQHRSLRIEIGRADQQHASLASFSRDLAEEIGVDVFRDQVKERCIVHERRALQQARNIVGENILPAVFGENLAQLFIVRSTKKDERSDECPRTHSRHQIERRPIASVAPAGQETRPERSIFGASGYGEKIQLSPGLASGPRYSCCAAGIWVRETCVRTSLITPISYRMKSFRLDGSSRLFRQSISRRNSRAGPQQ